MPKITITPVAALLDEYLSAVAAEQSAEDSQDAEARLQAALDALYGAPCPAPAPIASDMLLPVARLLSQYVCESRSEQGAHVYHLCKLLRGYAHARGTADGVAYPPACPEVDAAAACQQTDTVRRALGLTFDQFKRLWSDARSRNGSSYAYLPPTLLACFVPVELWPVTAQLLTDGPLLAKDRIERHLRAFGRQNAPQTKASTVPGKLAEGTLLSRRTAARRLMRHAVELHLIHSDILSAWTAVPAKWEEFEELPRNRHDNTAVPGHVARAAWQRCCAEVGEVLKVPAFDFEEQLAAAVELSPRRLAQGHFGLWRRRLALMLQAGLGCRKGAGLRITRADYEPSRPRRDGTSGPAVRLYERKRRGRYEPAWKPVPPELGRLIEIHIAFFDHYYRTLRGVDQVPEQLPLISTRGGEIYPDGTAYATTQYTALFSGQRAFARQDGSPDRRPVIALLPREGRPAWEGEPPHHLRSTVRCWLTDSVAQRWYAENDIGTEPAWIAEALLGHDKEDIERLYGGGAKPEDREHLAGIATSLNWLLLTTPLGARRRYDTEGYRAAALSFKANGDEIMRLELEIARLRRDKGELRERRARARGENPARFYALTDELDAIADRLEEAAYERVQARERMLDAERAMERLRTSPAARVAVSDDVPAGEYRGLTVGHLDAVDDEVFQGACAQDFEFAPMRDYVSLAELAPLVNLSVDTLKHLLAGRWPRRMHGAEPWARDAAVLTAWSTPKRRGVLVTNLNPRLAVFRDPELKRRLAQLLAAPYPDGWSPEYLRYAFPEAQRRLR